MNPLNIQEKVFTLQKSWRFVTQILILKTKNPTHFRRIREGGDAGQDPSRHIRLILNR